MASVWILSKDAYDFVIPTFPDSKSTNIGFYDFQWLMSKNLS